MTIYEELQARGLIAQVTDEEEIKELINNGKATFYIGFRPRSRFPGHVGHFMALMLMRRLAKSGQPAHRPHQAAALAWWATLRAAPICGL